MKAEKQKSRDAEKQKSRDAEKLKSREAENQKSREAENQRSRKHRTRNPKKNLPRKKINTVTFLLKNRYNSQVTETMIIIIVPIKKHTC